MLQKKLSACVQRERLWLKKHELQGLYIDNSTVSSVVGGYLVSLCESGVSTYTDTAAASITQDLTDQEI